jgi:hypothetical protein
MANVFLDDNHFAVLPIKIQFNSNRKRAIYGNREKIVHSLIQRPSYDFGNDGLVVPESAKRRRK